MQVKESDKRRIEEYLGCSYSDLKWLSQEEAVLANRQRNKLLKSISRKVNYSFKKNKIHIGSLSPGCSICGEGAWSCLFINRLCTAQCFYCTQERNIKAECDPSTEKFLSFDKPLDYVDYLEKINAKGVGFSGGEPFLVFDKLLKYINKIRGRFGKRIYLWMYTNGDLVTKEKLRKLKEAGLDEIRFDISVRNYDLHRLALAIGIIKTVTVEIPCIPEDFEVVKRCLIKLRKIGVKHLNLHQLISSRHNYRNFVKRGYTFLHQPLFSIFESEITALRIMNFALENKIGLPINYCTFEYKGRLQGRGHRKRIAYLVKEDFEELTKMGYIRRISIKYSPAGIKRIVKRLQAIKNPEVRWAWSATKNEIFLHSSLLKYLNLIKADLFITYFEPRWEMDMHSRKDNKEVLLSLQKKALIKKQLCLGQKKLSPLLIKSFRDLSIEGKSIKVILRGFLRDFVLAKKESAASAKQQIELLMSLNELEHLKTGPAALY